MPANDRAQPQEPASEAPPGTVGFCAGLGSLSCLLQLAGCHGFRNCRESSRFHVVHVAVNRNVAGNKGMGSDTRDIFDEALDTIGEREPVDVVACCRSRPFTAIMPPTLVHGRSLQAARQQLAHNVIAEQLHSTICMVDHKPFSCTQKLV